jgi:hypothetical protein
LIGTDAPIHSVAAARRSPDWDIKLKPAMEFELDRELNEFKASST